MARNREFDEADAVAAAARLFATRGYEGTSIDDLVGALGVHRGSMYRVFGSKLALFRRALRTQIDTAVLPWVGALPDRPVDAYLAAAHAGGAELGLVLVAAIERAGSDAVAAGEVGRVFAALTTAFGGGPVGAARSTSVIGIHLLARAGIDNGELDAAAHALAALSPIRGTGRRRLPTKQKEAS